jgi:hypothetical protein
MDTTSKRSVTSEPWILLERGLSRDGGPELAQTHSHRLVVRIRETLPSHFVWDECEFGGDASDGRKIDAAPATAFGQEIAVVRASDGRDAPRDQVPLGACPEQLGQTLDSRHLRRPDFCTQLAPASRLDLPREA